ncbi:Domain of uncharacterised function (DUF2825) [Shewanella putrefaciens]|nr:Domain of uncharacterised function (DUF2825) [Shewanella putrefaciens]
MSMWFIPVLTGNSGTALLSPAMLPVYPRAYGEQTDIIVCINDQYGLSPCLRGTGNKDALAVNKVRFIPVLTGNSCGVWHDPFIVPVYPRAYGEQTSNAIKPGKNGGLSPCLRGTENSLNFDISG